MKIKYIFIFLLTLIIVPFKVNAEECDNNFKNSMLQLVNNININYEYIENYQQSDTSDRDSNNKFILKFSNIPNDVMLNTSYYTLNNNNQIIESSPINEGENIEVLFTYKGDQCNSFLIKTKNIRLPFYNEYWSSDICSNMQDYKYCQKFTSTKIGYEFLKKNIDSYKEKNEVINVEENKDIKYKKIYFVGIAVIVLLVFVLIVIKIRRSRRKINI